MIVASCMRLPKRFTLGFVVVVAVSGRKEENLELR